MLSFTVLFSLMALKVPTPNEMWRPKRSAASRSPYLRPHAAEEAFTWEQQSVARTRGVFSAAPSSASFATAKSSKTSWISAGYIAAPMHGVSTLSRSHMHSLTRPPPTQTPFWAAAQPPRHIQPHPMIGRTKSNIYI